MHQRKPLQRTTIVLDDAGRQAARQLAKRWECSHSEAIRRALVAQRDVVLGAPSGRRTERVRALKKLFEAFEGTDPDAEIAARKREDAYF
jgi:hypothetical protein